MSAESYARLCNTKSDMGYRCSLKRDHFGSHIAQDSETFIVYDTWGNQGLQAKHPKATRKQGKP